MPGARNKIIINDNGNQGRHAAIDSDFDTLKMLAAEMEQMGLLMDPEALAMRDDMEKDCEAYDRAADKYIASNRRMIKRMYDFIERKRAEA